MIGMNSEIRKQFLLDKNTTFLNHGSFGACPIPVLERCQDWQREVERQPVEFFQRRAPSLLNGARAALGALLKVNHRDVVYISNASMGMNIVANSLNLKDGDEVLATDHEYGAVDRTWRFWGKEHGFTYKQVAIPFATPSEEMIELLWKGVSKKTKVISVSHISSPTATIFPVAEICRRARAEGIITVIDGAHAPGQIELDLGSIEPDFYVGNLHKWLCAPKGCAFLYADKRVQKYVKPLVVSWGYEAIEPSESIFLDYLEYLGTRDLSPFLTTSTAIEFSERHNWEKVRKDCHQILVSCEAEVRKITGMPSLYDSSERFAQMAAMKLPLGVDPVYLKEQLWQEFKIEVPVFLWNNQPLIRVSIQGYNTTADSQTLLHALKMVSVPILFRQ
jgi:isopenicillin-N epimerase